MTLLWEIGLAARTPSRAVRALVKALNTHYLRFFPLTEKEIPPGIDPIRHIACHCALGTAAQVLGACGVEVDRDVPWVRPWLLSHQLPDGGLNCDEAAYGRPVPRSSVVSTLPAAEAVLGPERRALAPEEAGFLDRATRYLGARRLARSVSKGGGLIDPRWLTPCFPRFYEYDVLRGLRLLARVAERTGMPVRGQEVAEALLALDRFFAEGAGTPRRIFEGARSYRPDASGVWRTGGPAAGFPLLERAGRELALPSLRREWRETLAILARPGILAS